MTLRTIVYALAICLACAACRRRPDAPPPPIAAPAEKTTMTTAIEGFTGKTAVDQLKRAKSTVRDAETTKKQQMDEALAE